MRTTRTHLLIGLISLLLALTLAACPGPSPTPTPTGLPPTAAPTTSPGTAPTATPDQWAEHTAGAIRIRLPKDWQVLTLNQGDLQTVFADFKQKNPELAKIIGSADALQGVSLWAFRNVAAGATFVDNLNIRSSPLGGEKIDRMADVVQAVEAQYAQLGFQIKASKSDLTIGGLPAALLVYSFPLVGADGKTATVTGHQYLIASATDLWVLSYSAAPENEAALAPVFEQSAQSFTVK